ncbi:MAG: hypothetical protein MJE12_16505 [Alphaproteobacteria bacterium]|nr:hypothetical protein [Alphaproteobacteria bacterium]
MILAGFVFDPAHTQHDIEEIAQSFRAGSVDELIERTHCLAGRWMLVLLRPNSEIALHDACGTMPVLSYQRDGKTWLASSSKLMDFCLDGLVETEEFKAASFDKYRDSLNSGLGYPGRLTEFDDVLALLPNHYLDLETCQAHRFYPTDKREPRSVEEVAPEIAGMLRDIMRSVNRRLPLAVGVTAGYDSRALLGALSCIDGAVSDARLFTFEDEFGAPPGHFDIVTGGKLSEAVGGVHSTVPAAACGPDAREVIRDSETMFARRFENWAAACSGHIADRTVLSGWCSEVGRAFIRWPGSEKASAAQIAECNGFGPWPFAIREHQEWHQVASEACEATGTNILDLFYWELRSRWIGSGLNIFSTGCNWVSVYSCRDLLDRMLSVPEEDRGDPHQRLYTAVIRELNPQLLDIPFNPHSLLARFKAACKWKARRMAGSVARALGIYEPAKRVWNATRVR